MTHAFFLVYLPTPLLHPALQTYNTNFMSEYILTTFYFTLLIHSMRNYSKPCYKNKFNYNSARGFKDAFCNENIPDDEVTVIRPPIGNPDFQDNKYCILKEMIYGLR